MNMSKKKKKPKVHKQRDMVAKEMFEKCKSHAHESKKDYKRHDKHKGKNQYNLPPMKILIEVFL